MTTAIALSRDGDARLEDPWQSKAELASSFQEAGYDERQAAEAADRWWPSYVEARDELPIQEDGPENRSTPRSRRVARA